MIKSMSKGCALCVLLLTVLLLQAAPGNSAKADAMADPVAGQRMVVRQGEPAQATPDGSLPYADRQIYLPMLVNGGLSATSAPAATLATPVLIEQAFTNGAITADERALYLAYALYEPQSLPAQFHSNVGWYGTQYVLEVQTYLQSISASSTDAVQQELSRMSTLASTVCDAEDGVNSFDSTNFHFSYGTIGGGLAIADYVTSMETTFNIEVTQFGWAKPPLNANNPFGLYPIQISNLGGGLYGYVAGGGGGDYTGFIGDNPNTPAVETAALSSCMVLNDDFDQFPEPTAQASLDATTSHEFVHAIQNGYGDPDPYEDAMWYESGAAYMEDEIFDNANSDYSYLWPEVENCLGEWPNNGNPGGISQYSNFLFFRHVAEHNGGTNVAGGGEDVMQHFWENVAAGQDALIAYNNALGTEGTNLPDAFHKYAIAAKFQKGCSGGYAGDYCFEEGPDYVTFMSGLPPVHGSIAANPGTYNGSIKNHYAVNWVTLPTSGSPYQVTLSNTAAGGQLRGSLVCDTGSAFTITPFAAVVGAGASSNIASFSAAGCTSVVAVITNQEQLSGNPNSCTSDGYTLSVSAAIVTPTPTDTPVAPTATATNTPTNTPVASTATATNTSTNTPVGSTATATNTPTNTPVGSTATATNTPTNTPVAPTATATNTPTNTPVGSTATATNTPTNTPIAPTATAISTPTGVACAPVPGNLVQNGGFESGKDSWAFYTSSSGNFNVTTPAYECTKSAQLQIGQGGSNVQLYQRGIQLQAGMRYRLSFAAYSSTGRDLGVYVHNHQAPYNNYGLSIDQVNLGTNWQLYTYEFTANGSAGDARLRFWLAPFAQAGDVYWIDDVRLVKVDGGQPTNTPVAPTNTPVGPTSTPVGPTPIPTVGPTPTVVPTSSPCTPVANNVLSNGSFEAGNAPWLFYTNSSGSFSTAVPAYECTKAARIQVNGIGTNVQLYQAGLQLAANTRYRLRFAAYSSTGADLGIYLHNHQSPYNNYGLSVNQVNLGTNWQLYTIDFTTSGFSGTTSDARLRFWLAPFAQAGDVYWIDAVSLVQLGNMATSVEESTESPPVITTSDGFLIGFTEEEFDPIVLGTIPDGNKLDEVDLVEEGMMKNIFLPSVTR